MGRRKRLAGLATVAVIAVAGCGSTVQMQTTRSAGSDGVGLSGATGTSLPGLPGGATEATSSGAGTSTAGAGSATNSGSGSGRPGSGGSSATSGADTPAAVPSSAARGLAAGKPLTVGVITSGNAGAYLSSLGLNENFGDQRLQAKAVADYLNKRGGVLGHPLKLTFFDYNASASAANNAATACSAFTEDTHAFASVGIAGMDDAFHACAYKRGMLVLTDGDIKSKSFFRKYPTTIEISDMDVNRKYRGMVMALKAEGFFTPGAKVGILSTDDPNDIEGIARGMKPALASIGITKTTDIAVSSTDPSQNASQTSSAVLKFRSAGVTHILFGRASAYLFAEGAQSQSYFPKMGVESRQSPALLMQGSNSPQQLVNTFGVGYQPVQDVDAAHDPGPLSSNQTLCKKILDDAGQGWGTNRLAMASALYLCEELLFLHDAFVGAADTSVRSFLGNVANLGSRFKSALTFRTRFSDQQHDGALDYRPLRYRTDCSCFVYTAPARPLP